MQHPFVTDLSGKTLDELQTTINDLTKKMTFASRMQNSAMLWQLQMAMDSYKSEFNRRMDEVYKKQNINGKINVSKAGDQ